MRYLKKYYLNIFVLIFMMMNLTQYCYASEAQSYNRISTWDELVTYYGTGDMEICVPAGVVVYVDKPITCKSQDGIWRIYGGGTIMRGETPDILLSFGYKNQVYIEDITFDGSASNINQQTEQPIRGILSVSGSESISLSNVIIQNNAGIEPAVSINTKASVKMDGCTVKNNSISKPTNMKNDKLLVASGVYIESKENIVITNCTFDSNDGSHALEVQTPANTSITNCSFTNNTNGGGMVGSGEIVGCKFTDNTGYYGVALMLDGETYVKDCHIENNLTLDVTDENLTTYGTSLSEVRESLINGNSTNNKFVSAALNQAGCVYSRYNLTIEDTVMQNNTSNTNFGGIRINPYQKTTLTIQGKNTNITDDIYGGPITNNSTGTFDEYPEIKELVLANPFGSYVDVNLSNNVYDSILVVKDGARLKNSIDTDTIQIQGLVYLESITYTDYKVTDSLNPESHIEILGCESIENSEYPRLNLLDHPFETNNMYTVATGAGGYNLTESDISCFAFQGNTWKNNVSPDILGVYFGSELQESINSSEAHKNTIVLFNGNIESFAEPNTTYRKNEQFCAICGMALCLECSLCPNCTEPDHISITNITENKGDHDHKNPPSDDGNGGSEELVDDNGHGSTQTSVKAVVSTIQRIVSMVGGSIVAVGVFGGCIALPILVYKKTEILRDVSISEYDDPQWLRVHKTLIRKAEPSDKQRKSFEVKVPAKVIHHKAVDSYKIKLNKHFAKKNHGSELLVNIININEQSTTYHFIVDSENPSYTFTYPEQNNQ